MPDCQFSSVEANRSLCKAIPVPQLVVQFWFLLTGLLMHLVYHFLAILIFTPNACNLAVDSSSFRWKSLVWPHFLWAIMITAQSISFQVEEPACVARLFTRLSLSLDVAFLGHMMIDSKPGCGLCSWVYARVWQCLRFVYPVWLVLCCSLVEHLCSCDIFYCFKFYI